MHGPYYSRKTIAHGTGTLTVQESSRECVPIAEEEHDVDTVDVFLPSVDVEEPLVQLSQKCLQRGPDDGERHLST